MRGKLHTARQAVIASLPVMAGYLVVGIGYGMTMDNAGYGVWWTLAMSLCIYGGSLQFVGASLLAGSASVVTTAIMSLIVQARHLFYGISMIGRYRDAGKYRPYLIFGLTDETYSILCNDLVPVGGNLQLYRFLVTLFDQSYWVVGSVLGALIGAALPFSLSGVEFAMTALFTATFTEQWLTSRNHLPAVTGIVVTALCRIFFGASYFLIPAMVAITAVLLAARGREEKRHD